MNLLFLTNLLPYPGISGGTQTTLKKINSFIDAGFSVQLVFMNSENTDQALLKEFEEKYSKKISITYIFNKNSRRSINNLIKSFLYGRPFNLYRNYNQDLVKIIKEYSKKADLIFCDHLEMSQYLDSSMYERTILLEHNAEYKIWERYAKQIRNPIVKLGIYLESRRLKKYELNKCSKIRYVLIAPSDISNLISSNDGHFIETYHPANDYMLELAPLTFKKENHNILFIGTMTWQANYQGVFWFIKNVFPLILEKFPDAIFNVVGKFNGEMPSDKYANVIFHGFVENIEDCYKNAAIFVSPLLFGSGVKIKLLDSMYRGLPFVTTSVGAESLDLVSGENCFIKDSPIDFANSVMELFENESLWNKFSTSTRMLANEKYTWKTENEKVFHLINNITTGSK